MRRHAKASSAGSTSGIGDSRRPFGRAVTTRGTFSETKGSGAPSHRVRLAAPFLILPLVALALFAAPASASQGLTSFFGHTGSAAGQFATGVEAPPTSAISEKFEPGPAGIAVDDATGDIYVADHVDNRVEQFDSNENFIRAWGVDTIPAGATGTGTLVSGSKEVTSVVTASKAFISGQEVSGTGIPAGTTITEVISGAGAASKLILSNKATAPGSNVTLTAAGSPANVPQNEKQTVSVKAASGNFKLKFATTMPKAEATTANIALGASAATVKATLESLANIGAGNLEVTGAAGGPYTVEFKGKFADTNVAQFVPVAGSPALAGPPGPTVLIATEQEGAGRFEKCTEATTCQAGAPVGLAGGMNKPVGVAVNQANQNVYVTDVGNNRVEQFDASGTFVRTFGANVVESGPGNKPEIQSVKIAATSGTFVLTFGNGTGSTTTATGTGTYASGSNEITSLVSASGSAFTVGKQVSGAGIPLGTKITAVEAGGTKLILSGNTTEAKTATALTADLPYDASASSVETALNALNTIGGAFGSVAVSGGPGDTTGSNPYQATFGGALANTNAAQIAVNPNNLGVAEGTVLSCIGGPTTGSPPPTLSYQWLRNGVEISGSTGSTYTTVAADAGKAIQCKVKAIGSEGASVQANTPMIASPVPATAPPVPGTPAISGTLSVGNTLTCANGTWTGAGVSFTYQWLRNGAPIGGATSSTYALQAADNQTGIQCEVTGANTGGGAVRDSQRSVIRSEPPGNTGVAGTVPAISGTLSVGNTLTCANGTWTGAGLSFGYQWLRNGIEISGSTGSTYTTVAADAGTAIQCKVTATNAAGSAGSAISANALIAPVSSPTPPVGPTDAISVSGTRNVGNELACTPGTWTPASPAPEFSFQWLRNGAPISGATTNVYTLQAADLDKQVQCQVTGTNFRGASMAISPSAAGNATVVNPPFATSESAAPSIATTTREGAQAEICNAATDVCQTGASGATAGAFAATTEPNHAAIAPGGPYAGDLYVSDAVNFRIQIFNSSSGEFIAVFGKNVLKSGPETAGKNLCIASLGDVCGGGANTGGNSATNTEVYGFGSFGCSCGQVKAPTSFAIDGNGSVYVSQVLNFTLQKYSPDLTSEQDFAPDLCSRSEGELVQPTGCREVAVDPHTNDVYVAYGIRGEREICGGLFGCEQKGWPKERAIARLDSSGEEVLERLLEGFAIPKMNGMAIDGSTGNERSGHLYVTVNGPEQRVDVIGEAPSPDFEFEPIDPEEVKPHEATVHATINPNGNKVDTTYQFETLIQGGVWHVFPVPPGNAGNGTTSEAVSVTIPGLRPNTRYRVRLSVFKSQKEFSPEQTFTTPPDGPQVETGEARWSGPPSSNPSLTFFGSIDDNNLPVLYYFEYGTNASYGARVPLFETGGHAAAQEPFLGRQTANGLDPAGSYHYRIVARTSSGTTVGADREVGPAQSGGRFPEQVSPVDKGVGTVRESAFALFFPQESLQAAANGGRIAYPFEYGNPEATSGGEMLELAGRGASTWGTEQLIAASNAPSLRASPQNGHGFFAASQGEVNWLSPELSCFVLEGRGTVNSETPPADVEDDIWHLYLRDAVGNFKMITPTPINGNQNGTRFEVLGAASDCGHIVFKTGYRLLPGLPVAEAEHIYEWEAAGGSGGTLRSVDVLPDGSTSSSGGGTGMADTAAIPPNNTVSQPGGNRVTFVAASDEGGDNGKQAIFVRKSHAVTIDVSQSQTAVPNTGTTTKQMTSADGSHVFFTAMAGIASNSVTLTGNSLYDYNVDTGVLKDLTPDSNADDTAGAVVEGVFGAGDDGSYIYFATKGQLIPGQGKTYAENNFILHPFDNVYVSHNGALSYVGLIAKRDTVGDDAGRTRGAFVTEQAVSVGQRLKSRVTPDGHRLLFVSSVNLTPYDSAEKREIYRYSSEGSMVACVSCRPDGLVPTVDNEGIHINGSQVADTYHSRAISADGSRVFFTSSEELAAGGTGKNNAYEWHNGTITLLARESEVLDASSDGSNVFVLTSEPLAAQDRDTVPDIYDLRTNGGFPYIPSEPCDPLTENSCQGTPPAPPAQSGDPASSTFNGPGNPPAPSKPKPKKPHKKKHHKKKTKHHKKTKKRAAKRTRGGAK